MPNPKPIFDAVAIRELAVQWKSSTGRVSTSLLKQIVNKSTPMLEQLVINMRDECPDVMRGLDSAELVELAQSRVKVWLERWQPRHNITPWFFKCARSVFLAEVAKRHRRWENLNPIAQ
jgi:DNA-directed RNA polymerase specialized sigma24 family protein